MIYKIKFTRAFKLKQKNLTIHSFQVDVSIDRIKSTDAFKLMQKNLTIHYFQVDQGLFQAVIATTVFVDKIEFLCLQTPPRPTTFVGGL